MCIRTNVFPRNDTHLSKVGLQPTGSVLCFASSLCQITPESSLSSSSSSTSSCSSRSRISFMISWIFQFSLPSFIAFPLLTRMSGSWGARRDTKPFFVLSIYLEPGRAQLFFEFPPQLSRRSRETKQIQSPVSKVLHRKSAHVLSKH